MLLSELNTSNQTSLQTQNTAKTYFNNRYATSPIESCEYLCLFFLRIYWYPHLHTLLICRYLQLMSLLICGYPHLLLSLTYAPPHLLLHLTCAPPHYVCLWPAHLRTCSWGLPVPLRTAPVSGLCTSALAMCHGCRPSGINNLSVFNYNRDFQIYRSDRAPKTSRPISRFVYNTQVSPWFRSSYHSRTDHLKFRSLFSLDIQIMSAQPNDLLSFL